MLGNHPERSRISGGVEILASSKRGRKSQNPALNPEGRGQQAEWERDREKNNLQHAMDRDADDAKRQQKQPDERIRDESEHRQRPAKNKQNAPQKESEHIETSFPCLRIRSPRQKVP